uniref:Uncharacterized protein n=1 Tax=Ciona savignyi TaxID=51511 RepID=H2Y579_CIOSA
MSIVSQKSNLSLSSNSKSNRISPDGSTSNLSISSELSPTSSTNEEPVKPRSLSRNSSSKSRRSKKKSTSHDDHNSHSFVTSPITSFNQSNASDTFTTIISPMSTSSDASSFETSATSVRSSKHGSESKPRIKDRFLEFFTKRNRSKSLAYGSLLGLHHKHNRDDSSSGYVSDHLATNDHLVMEDYRGNHKYQPPEAANTNHAGRSSMTSSNNDDVINENVMTSSKDDIMIQNEAQITNGRRSVDQHEKETKPLLWNTNNSGQVGSTLHDQETTGNTEKVDQIRPKHSRSLPDMLDVVETKREIPNTLNLHRKSKKET